MVIIRTAAEKDAGDIIGFQQKMAMETENVTLDPDVLAMGLKRLFEDPAKGKYYVAEQNEEVIGCLMTTFEWSEWRCGNVLWIQSVYVKPAYRGKRVFKKMYEHIKSLVTPQSEYRGIRLYVDQSNKAAQEVYQKLGMNGEHYQVFEWMAD